MCFSRRWRWEDERESRRESVWDLFERETRERPEPVTVADHEREAERRDDAQHEPEPARS